MEKADAIYMLVGFIAGYGVCYWFTVVPMAEKIQQTLSDLQEFRKLL